MKIIYLHGFNSDKNGRTAKALEGHYKTAFSAISYDYINADIAHEQISTLIEQIQQCGEKEIILVGTSLGGFWTNHFAQALKLKCVLANPSLHPSISLQKYIGTNINFSTGEVRSLTIEDCGKYSKYELPMDKRTQRITLLGVKDDVIDYRKTAAELAGTRIVLDRKEGHRIENIKRLIQLIDEMIEGIAHN